MPKTSKTQTIVSKIILITTLIQITKQDQYLKEDWGCTENNVWQEIRYETLSDLLSEEYLICEDDEIQGHSENETRYFFIAYGGEFLRLEKFKNKEEFKNEMKNDEKCFYDINKNYIYSVKKSNQEKIKLCLNKNELGFKCYSKSKKLIMTNSKNVLKLNYNLNKVFIRLTFANTTRGDGYLAFKVKDGSSRYGFILNNDCDDLKENFEKSGLLAQLSYGGFTAFLGHIGGFKGEIFKQFVLFVKEDKKENIIL